MKKSMNIWFFILCLFFVPTLSFGETIFFQENFDDTNFASRGWYDPAYGGGAISLIEHIPGSLGSFECHWTQGGSGCTGGIIQRHKFMPTNSVYLSFWIKHSTSWTGKGTHFFYLLTTEDGDYSGLARDHLDAYYNEGTFTRFRPDLELQDVLNIDQSNINVDLTQQTEYRSSQGCNGLLENTHSNSNSCYLFDGIFHNIRSWESPVAFSTTPGPYYMGDWHHVEAYYKLSDIDSNGKGMTNGILRLWIDGQLLIDKTGVNFRTGAHPNMLFNQLILAPYMGPSEADQTIWIDNLIVANEPPGGTGGQYTITATAGAGGTISPAGNILVNAGSSQAFTITPSAGCRISDVIVDGVSKGAVSTFMFTNISANHAITANFACTSASIDWSTTYNCDDWIEYPDPLNCDGLVKGGGWTCTPPESYEQITSAANNPSGAGGKGQRHWLGDVTNVSSGGLKVPFGDNSSEIWFRWYMRFQPGFQWAGGGFKVLYFYNSDHPTDDGFMWLMIHNDPRVWTMYTPADDRLRYTNGGGWEDIYPTGVSDGSWHEFEVHLKRETTATSRDGVWEMWVDGELQGTHKDIDYGLVSSNVTIDNVTVGSNSGAGANGGCAAVDFDDLAYSYTGYIGPIPIPGQQYTITASADTGGTISPTGPVLVNSGASQTFTITPATGYQVAAVTVDGVSQGAITGYTFTNVTANHTISASFTLSPVTYTINASAGSGGTISPSGAVPVSSGANQTFTITPNPSYNILDVAVDGVSRGPISSYIFTDVRANHTIAASFSTGGTSLLWSTTYNCADWNKYGDPLTCDGIQPYGGWTCDQGGTFYEQITATANNPSGPGGKGERRWKGDWLDEASGGTIRYFDPSGEIWVRWYMRYQTGFKWSVLNSDLVMYLDNNTYLQLYEWDKLNLHVNGVDHVSAAGGWDTIMQTGAIDSVTGHRTSDGQFHSYELHLKNNGSSGIVEVWVDGVLRISSNNVNVGTDFTYVKIGGGANNANNGSCYYIDYDDIAVSNTGYIGPIPAAWYQITPMPTGCGTISPSTPITVNSGGSITFYITPCAGYYTVDVQVDGVSQGPLTSYTFSNVTANHVITADFALLNLYKITTAVGPGGSATVTNSGLQQTFTVTPNVGSLIDDVTIDGVSYGRISTYMFTNVTANHVVNVSFALDSYVISASAGTGGTISPSGPVSVSAGANQIFTITPDAGYQIADVKVDGVSKGAITSYTFVNVTAGHTIVASFGNTFAITASAGTGGTISPSGSVVVPTGSNQTFTIQADTGYQIENVTVDGTSQGAIRSYTFTSVSSNHTISASFTPLLWSTTYNCTDWNTYADPLNCDGLVPYGGWYCNQGGTFYEQITAAANNPSGGGGKGQRSWTGDGANNGSGGTRINFDSPQSELWIRWYMRYQAGFKWNPMYGDILLYLDNNRYIHFSGWDTLSFHSAANYGSTTGGWDTIMSNGAIDPATGHRTSDGQFHYYELHVKNNGSSGIVEIWVDGVRYASYTNADIGTNFTYVAFTGEANNPNNGMCSYIDYDDIAISNTGYIGPMTGM